VADAAEAELPFVARDGLPLVGTLFSPGGGDGPRLPAVVVVHGFGGSRGSSIRLWGQELARRGFPAFVVGTRGSDRAWTHGGRRYGGAHEWLDEAPRDLRGAADALRRRGHEQFILAGQSLGCVKVVHAQAVSPVEGVVGVVARAGPRFAPDALARYGEAFAAAMRAAEERVAAGDPEGLIETAVPVPGPFAAGTFLEKYGPHGRYDWPVLIERVAVPWLVVLGGADPSPLVQAAIAHARGWKTTPPGCEVRVVPHWQHGIELPGEDVPAGSAQLLADWWARREAARPTTR
jgi:dienelactone hydrolase